jgi:hypothetical protein
MKENLLQYIWKFQYFQRSGLSTAGGDALQIIHPGTYNSNQGPDFLEAKIKINDTLWAGNIELHIHSSDWNRHRHSEDKNFNNVILHVVWKHDEDIKDSNGNSLPTLELQGKVPKLLLERYQMLMDGSRFIPCENLDPAISDLSLYNWKQRLAAERLLRKSDAVLQTLQQNNNHWEETFWWLIAANFGLKVNSNFFGRVARSLPLSLLAKHKNNIIQTEALLFGQAGLLNQKFTEKYPQLLQKEYLFYQKKYKLVPVEGALYFLRMRPANFPTVRLAQLAMLIHNSNHLFSKIKETGSLAEVKKMLTAAPNDYWHYHYVFDQEGEYKIKNTGRQMSENIIINTIVPVIFSYGVFYKNEFFKNKAIDWLEKIPPEKNKITKGFERLHYTNKSALDSQAFLQLYNEYCSNRRCLECAIGDSLLKNEKK